MFKKVATLIFGVAFLLSSVSTFADSSAPEIPNQTEIIRIVVNQKTDTKLSLSYYVVEIFNKESRGIFLVLPKNQDGIWTDYKLNSVQRTVDPVAINVNSQTKATSTTVTALVDFLVTRNTGGLQFQNEPYDEIKEWNEFRIRVGKPDRILPLGVFVYKIDLEVSLNPNYNYNLTLLEGWGEELNKIEVIDNGQNLCGTKISCNKDSTRINVFEGKPKPSSWNQFYSLIPYFFILLIVCILTYFLWNILAKDNLEGHKIDKPEFEPPDVLPWEADYLIKEGGITVRNTLLAYILWLNTHKYIEFKTDLKEHSANKKKHKMKIKVLKELPELLPHVFNRTVLEIAKSDLDKGILASKINENDAADLNSLLADNLSKYYSQKPIYGAWGWALGWLFLLGFIGFIGFNILKSVFLIGNSYGTFGLFIFFSSIIPAILIANGWAKVNSVGAKIKAYCHRYRYYIEKVETLKLDFSNNPKEGVQYYLKAVAFAASFGLLAQFAKYFEQLIPNNTDIQTSVDLFDFYTISSFYIPSSDFDAGIIGDVAGGFVGGGGSW